jgi:hypothetical protein
MKSILFLILVALSVNANAQQQGICGSVSRTSGNQMPGPDKKSTGSAPIEVEIFIYEATTTSQVTNVDGFYSAVTTRLIKMVKSKKDGTFTVKLPSGIYSVFVKEKSGLWANTFDGQGRINPVEVTTGNYTTFTINVNYEAAY